MHIAITNIGFISALGDSFQEWKMNANDCNVKALASQTSLRLDDFDPTIYLGNKKLSYKTRSTLFALAACEMMFQRDPSLSRIERDSLGLCLASNAGSLQSIASFVQTTLNHGFRSTTPMQFPLNMVSAAAANLAIWFDIQGVNATLSSGISASLDALKYGSVFLKKGRLDRFIVGATEEISETTLSIHNSISCLKKSEIRAGEGAAVVLLEGRDSITDCGTIFAEICGYGHAFCTKANEDQALMAAISAIRRALSDAGLDAEDIDTVCLNRNGYRLTDEAERKALGILFPNKPKQFDIKQTFGECYSASGMLQVVGACLAPEKSNYESLLHRFFLINCFDFESNYSSLILRV